jgi:hypothetical protein
MVGQANRLDQWQIQLLRIKHIYVIINKTNISSSLPLPEYNNRVSRFGAAAFASAAAHAARIRRLAIARAHVA